MELFLWETANRGVLTVELLGAPEGSTAFFSLAVLGLLGCAWAFPTCCEWRLLIAMVSLVVEHGL